MKKFEYFSNLIPVLWESGHMGNFFLRISADKFVRNGGNSTKKYFNHNAWYEWSVEDRICNYFGFRKNDSVPYFGELKEIVKNISDLRYYNANMIHVILQLTKNYYSMEGFSLKDRDCLSMEIFKNLNHDHIVSLHNNEFAIDDCVFPYIKDHIGTFFQNFITIMPHNVCFKKIILVTFPKNKRWLSEILLFYKRYYSGVHDIGYVTPDFNIYNITRIVNISDTLLKYKPVDTQMQYILSNYNCIEIDMYDLIFNQNTDQLKAIDVECDESVIDLIMIAKRHCLEICDKFELDHTICIENDKDFDLPKTNKLNKVLDKINKKVNDLSKNLTIGL